MKSKQYILGIDPGLKGACALLSLDGTEIDWFKIPTRIEVPGTQKRLVDAKALLEYLDNFDILTCYIEKQEYQNAKLIANYGICVAVLDILQIPFLAINPASWIRSLKAKAEVPDIKQGKNKEFTFKAFDILYPGVELPIKEKDLRDDDIADACLLAKLCYLNIEIERD